MDVELLAQAGIDRHKVAETARTLGKRAASTSRVGLAAASGRRQAHMTGAEGAGTTGFVTFGVSECVRDGETWPAHQRIPPVRRLLTRPRAFVIS